MSALIPANVEILFVGDIWPATVETSALLALTPVTAELIPATVLTAPLIPATVVMLGKFVDINCLFTASVSFTGFAKFLITLLLASYLSSVSKPNFESLSSVISWAM